MAAPKKTYYEDYRTTVSVTPSGVSSTSSTHNSFVFFTNSSTFISNPGYRSAIAKMQDASSQYSSSYCNGASSGESFGSVSYKGGGSGSDRISITPSLPSVPAPPTSFNNELIGRFRSKVASESGKFQSLVPLAESRELGSLVRNMAKTSISFVKDWNDLRRGRPWNVLNKLKQVPSAFSDAWLTYNFGIRPLAMDAQDVAKSIAIRLSKQVPVRISASVQLSTMSSGVWQRLGDHYTGITYYTKVANTITHRAKMTGGFKTTVLAGNNYLKASEQFGLTLPELIPAAWALTPYSWIFDYFGNVGDVLEDTFSVLPQPYYLTRSTKSEVDSKLQVKTIVSNNVSSLYQSLSTSSKDGGCVMGNFSRVLLPTIPVRTLSFDSQDDIARGSVSKLLNLVSLLSR